LKKNNKMKKIIIALDYDKSAEKVAEAGYELAKGLHAEVVLLHVVDEPAYYTSTAYSPIMGFTGFNETEMLQADIGMLEREAKRYLQECKKHLGDEMIDTIVLEGDFTEAVSNAVTTYNADLLIMGTHSRTGIDRLLMGNLAEKILKHTIIPVLVIPTHIEERDKK
jgi:nucleotide-binding universal stress UspA family protein